MVWLKKRNRWRVDGKFEYAPAYFADVDGEFIGPYRSVRGAEDKALAKLREKSWESDTDIC
jgi:hypothetical protein